MTKNSDRFDWDQPATRYEPRFLFIVTNGAYEHPRLYHSLETAKEYVDGWMNRSPQILRVDIFQFNEWGTKPIKRYTKKTGMGSYIEFEFKER